MDTNDFAAQRQMATIAAQQMMFGMSDDPQHFREEWFSKLFRQAWNARHGKSDGMSYMTVPF
ncbi:MAG: hypothetical protein ACRECA_08655 [Pseudolabrys sp.]